jgi:hypothetical protein
MTIEEKTTDIPRIYQPFDYWGAARTSDLNDPAGNPGFQVGSSIIFPSDQQFIEGDQKFISYENDTSSGTVANHFTKIKLKKGHIYKCTAIINYYDSSSGATNFKRDYSFYDLKKSVNIGLKGTEEFADSKFDHASFATAFVDAKNEDAEIKIVVTSAVGNAIQIKAFSKIVVEVVTDRSGPWNENKTA